MAGSTSSQGGAVSEGSADAGRGSGSDSGSGQGAGQGPGASQGPSRVDESPLADRSSGPPISIDKALPTPAYLQLRDQLSRAIDVGDLPAGSALPSERALAVGLGLSRMTVRRAFEELVSAGVVEQRQGSGTFVRAQPLEQVIDRVLGFTDEARGLGFTPGSRLLTSESAPVADHVAGVLGVRQGEVVLRVTRLRTADDEPLALQDAYLAPHLGELSLELLSSTGSLYRTLEEQFGLRPSRARQTIAARLPTERECRVLGIGKDVPVLSLERTTYDRDGTAFEYVRSAYRGDIYRMALDLRAY